MEREVALRAEMSRIWVVQRSQYACSEPLSQRTGSGGSPKKVALDVLKMGIEEAWCVFRSIGLHTPQPLAL
jgi:hypothetical protein